MKEITVESLFGLNAGVVWRALNQHGPSNLANLIETTSLSREEVFGALGWLGRENKIVMEQKGRAMIFSLREKEAHLAVRQEAAAGSKPRGKSKTRKRMPAKRARNAHRAKAEATESHSNANLTPVNENERMKEFLLY